MDLAMLNSGTPQTKTWLNPVVFSIESDKVYQISTENTITSTPVTLTPTQWVNSITFASAGSSTINTPSAAEFKTYFGEVKPDGFTFNVDVYKTSSTNMTIALGAGVTEYRLGASQIQSLTVTPGPLGYSLRYVINGGAWTVYYTGSST